MSQTTRSIAPTPRIPSVSRAFPHSEIPSDRRVLRASEVMEAPAHSNGPLASITGARDAVRRLKEQGLHDAPVRVQLATGTYALTAPVEFLTQETVAGQR